MPLPGKKIHYIPAMGMCGVSNGNIKKYQFKVVVPVQTSQPP